jgi:hypothetical protein
MLRKILVWSSLLFLFGALALVTYLTFFAGTSVSKKSTYKLSAIILSYTVKRQDFDVCSIKQLDSLSAASNFYFTKINATEYPLSGL